MHVIVKNEVVKLNVVDLLKDRGKRKRQEREKIQEFLESYGIDEKAFKSLIATVMDEQLDTYIFIKVLDTICFIFFHVVCLCTIVLLLICLNYG